MLRRTRARQVAPVYRTAIANYPTPADLAVAKRSSIRKELQSLGLTWRIAQFQTMARELVDRFDGRVPAGRDELVSLTGVSDYVADAVLVFAHGQKRAVVDANIARIITRYFGIREHAEARRDRAVRVIADSLLPRSEPRDFNFAMLDLAALVCTPQAPRHEICPLRRMCRKARGPTSPHRHAPP